MSKLKIFLAIFLLFFSLHILSQEKIISGNITGFVDGQYLLLGNSELGKLVDSTKIINSKFFFKNPITKNIPVKLYIAAREDKNL